MGHVSSLECIFWGGFLALLGCFGVLWKVFGKDFGWATEFELFCFHDVGEGYWYMLIVKAPKKLVQVFENCYSCC